MRTVQTVAKMIPKIDAGAPQLLKNGGMSTDRPFPAPLSGPPAGPPAPYPGQPYNIVPVPPPAPRGHRVPTEPLPFHRLNLSWERHRWYKPLLVGLIAAGLYLGALFMLTLAEFIAALISPAFLGFVGRLDTAMSAFDLRDPMVFTLAMGSIILMLPAIWLATLMLGARPTGLLSSVAGRLRWRWLGLCLALSLGVMSLLYVVAFSLDAAMGIPFDPQFGGERMWLMIGLTLLLIPVQATAEEYVFRGYLMQGIGSWLRHPAFAILLPIPLFVFGHDYDIYGQLDVGIFALAAGWLTWRTGGLEAAIGMHIVNNVLIFLLGAVDLADVNASEGSLPALIASVITMGAYVWVVTYFAKRRNIARLREPAPVPPAAPQWQAPVYPGQAAGPGFSG